MTDALASYFTAAYSSAFRGAAEVLQFNDSVAECARNNHCFACVQLWPVRVVALVVTHVVNPYPPLTAPSSTRGSEYVLGWSVIA